MELFGRYVNNQVVLNWLFGIAIVIAYLLILLRESFYTGSAWESSRPVRYRLKNSLSRPWDIVLNAPVRDHKNFPHW